jgi:putative SOS response-associated peptidase YedK
MCGRYASARKRIELLEEFSVERDRVAEPLEPDYNVAPTKPVYAVLTRRPRAKDQPASAAPDQPASAGSDQPASAGSDQPGSAAPDQPGSAAPDQPADGEVARELRVVRWGLVPFWAKDISIGSRLINARAETVSEKPAFRRAFERRRCLLPADGYYEWQRPAGGPGSDRPSAAKQPFYISRGDGGPLAFAGLYELWRDSSVPEDDPDSWLWTAAIITTSAPDDLGAIHDRMPMVIPPGSWDDWLDPANRDAGDLRALLAPAAAGGLISFPVSRAVNSVRNNGPELIEPVELAAAGLPNGAAPGGAGAGSAGAGSAGPNGAVPGERAAAPPAGRPGRRRGDASELSGSEPDTLF